MMVSRLQFVRGSIAALSVAARPSESPPTLVRSANRAYEFAPQFPETPISPTFDQCEISRDGTLLISVFSTSRVIRLRGLEIIGDLRFPWYGSPDAIAHGPGVAYGVFSGSMGLPATGGSASIIRGNWKLKTFDVLKFPTGDLPGYLLPVGDSLFATNGAEIYKVAGTKNAGALYGLLDGRDKTIVASETGYWALGKSDVLFYEVSTKRTLRSKSETLFDADAVKLRGGRSGCYTVSTKSGTTSIRRFSVDAGRIREGDVVRFESGELVSEPSVDGNDTIWLGRRGLCFCIDTLGLVRSHRFADPNLSDENVVQSVLSDGTSTVWIVGRLRTISQWRLTAGSIRLSLDAR